MDNSKVCKHKSHQKTNTNSQKSKQSELRGVFIQSSRKTKFSSDSSCFYCFPIFRLAGSLKSKDSGLSPEPNYDKYPCEGSDFLVSTRPWGWDVISDELRRREQEEVAKTTRAIIPRSLQ